MLLLKVTKGSKEDVYIKLMEKFSGLTPDIIADMNPYLQYVLLRGPRIVSAGGIDSYNEYLARHG